MDKTLLINQINTREHVDRTADIFFLIGNMDDVRDRLMNVFNSQDSVFYKKCLFKYNGITLNIHISSIPKVIALLVDEGIELYEVYELYDPT